MVIYDHAAKYAPWFPGLKGEPEFIEDKTVKQYQLSGIKHLPEKSDEALNLKKFLYTLDQIIHSRLKD